MDIPQNKAPLIFLRFLIAYSIVINDYSPFRVFKFDSQIGTLKVENPPYEVHFQVRLLK